MICWMFAARLDYNVSMTSSITPEVRTYRNAAEKDRTRATYLLTYLRSYDTDLRRAKISLRNIVSQFVSDVLTICK